LPNTPDIQLIQQAQDKKSDPVAGAAAVGELYDRYQEAVFRYIWARVSNPQVAEDLTGEVFTRMVAHLPRYTVTGRPFLAWLYTIAGNLVSDHHRKNGTRAALTIEQIEALPSEDTGPVEAAEKQFFIRQVRAALDDLKPQQREVLILRFIVGLPLGEVASVTGKSIGAVKIAQHRALAALRARLEQKTGNHP
jgi:RNA polymerase sigma-70 factor (ECF subfamily)